MESLRYPSPEKIERTHKKKRLIPNPNSSYSDVKCGVCQKKTVIFSCSQTAIMCKNCNNAIAKPTGGKARLTLGCKFKTKPRY